MQQQHFYIMKFYEMPTTYFPLLSERFFSLKRLLSFVFFKFFFAISVANNQIKINVLYENVVKRIYNTYNNEKIFKHFKGFFMVLKVIEGR